MLFNELELIEPLLKALEAEGYTSPTPIQEQTIPSLLKGRDVQGSAQTGTGKTAAFTLPMLQILSESQPAGPRKDIRALILTPTRELAIQIDESIKAYGKNLKMRHAVIFGGVGQKPQTDALRNGIDILTATPGRLLDLMNQGHVRLDKIEYFVLDEADRMLDMGFIHDVKKILAKLPNKRQTALFSATFPAEIQNLCNSVLNNPVKVEVVPTSTAAETVSQAVYLVDKKNKRFLLEELLTGNKDIREALVFTRTKHGADKINQVLNKAGVKSAAIHGNKSQIARQKALKDFKAGHLRVLVATDIAARGIDIDELSHVINFDIPNEPETYVHRIGRTGRAGSSGKSLSFCEPDERPYLKAIHKLLNKELDVVLDHNFTISNAEDVWKDMVNVQPANRQNQGRNRSVPPNSNPDTKKFNPKKRFHRFGNRHQ